MDLQFPHHENEIAQSRCAFGHKVMANVWMHNGFLQVEGRKMSKSEGNFITINELLQKWPGEVLRFNMLRTHYRQPIDWTERGLQESRRNLLKLQEWYQPKEDPTYGPRVMDSQFMESMLDDMNTPSAIARLFALHREITVAGNSHDPRQHQLIAHYSNALRLLGFEELNNFEHRGMGNQDVAFTREIDAAIARRLEAFKAKDFAEADRIRDELTAQGIQLRDSKDSETGERITTWELKR
ncbi:MAG: DALR domain-containing protein [Anderseniella sp.]|nr:DALR domain-containing protein [Anderseniella sp.]